MECDRCENTMEFPELTIEYFSNKYDLCRGCKEAYNQTMEIFLSPQRRT